MWAWLLVVAADGDVVRAQTGADVVLLSPTGVSYDGAGNLYFADSRKHETRFSRPER